QWWSWVRSPPEPSSATSTSRSAGPRYERDIGGRRCPIRGRVRFHSMSEHTILDPTLLSLLACPQDKRQLHLVRTGDGADVLYHPRVRVACPIDNGLPVLLADEARAVGEAEHADFARQFGE